MCIRDSVYGIPLVLLGVPPYVAALFYGFVSLYQFIVHTEMGWSLGALDGIVYTPAAHRSHHSCERTEADANYGGFFVVFDRLFGTFTPTRPNDRPAVYGLPDRRASDLADVAFGELRRVAAALRSADPVAEARRLLSSGQNNSPFGISGGGTPQFMDATAGGIAGRVLVLLQATESIGTSGTATIDADVAFSSTDQSRVGSVGRVMEELFVNVSVSGTMPTGYDADSLRQYLIGSTYVQPEIGGVPQLQIPLAAMINTNFIDRSFQMRALLDPGNFASFNFNWSSDALTPPAPGSGTWVAALQITAIFSEPLRKAA